MLIKSRYFNGMNVEALDGMAGKLAGLLVDSTTWKVRYIVVQNRSLLLNRKKFLISTFAISSINYESSTMKLDLTLEGVNEEPFLEKAEGIGVQVKKHFFDLSGWPYFDKMYNVGWLPGPFGILWQTKGVEHSKRDTKMHLQTSNLMDGLSLLGMSLSCKDRDFGVIKNLMIDPHSWECRFIEIRKVKWLPSDSTVLPIQLITNVDWKKRQVELDTHERKVLEAPYYNPRIFSSLSERLFLQYYNINQIDSNTHGQLGESQITKSIA